MIDGPSDACTSYMLNVPREEQEKRGYIRTHPGGKLVDPLNLQPEDIDIRVIAHHTSNICRYTGACPEFYSVAQHSVLVARCVPLETNPTFRLAALLHDASEAYLNDMSSPVKHQPDFEAYRKYEEKAMRVIYEAFGVPFWMLAETKVYDDRIYRREVASFWRDGDSIPEDFITPWTPDQSRIAFVNEFCLAQTRMG